MADDNLFSASRTTANTTTRRALRDIGVHSTRTSQRKIRSACAVAFAVALLTQWTNPTRADVRINGLFTDGAVLQSDRPIPVWGTAEEGETVTVELRGQRAAAVARNGTWMVRLSAMRAGGPYKLNVRGHNRIALTDILIGEVYLCGGQSNIEWPLALAANGTEAVAEARDPMLRLYSVPRRYSETPLADVSGRWQACTPESARGFSAVAYFFGRTLRRSLAVPVGLIQSAWSGTPAQAWTSRPALLTNPALAAIVNAYDEERAGYQQGLAKFETARAKDDSTLPSGSEKAAVTPKPPRNPSGKTSPTALYNAMIAPLAPYAIRGVIWYQGESNTGAPDQYRALFPAMIEDWRNAWKEGDFPFLYVQLAPFMRARAEPGESAWAELRDAQLATLRAVPNVGMTVITDVGDETDIHPRDKQPVGERLGLLARALVYHQDVEAYGPLYDGMSVDGDRVVLRFQHVGGGLVARGAKTLAGFTIAGPDRKFVNAVAIIRGETVMVSALQVPRPVSVRYGWADFPQGNLWNQAGWPASPFRTDAPGGGPGGGK